MNRNELQAIKARAEAATPGPWEVEKDSDIEDIDFGPIVDWPWRIWGPDQAPLIDFSGGCDVRSEDAEFIAHVRTDIPRLLLEIENLQAKNAKLDKQLGECRRKLN